jgi:hypothetical protein
VLVVLAVGSTAPGLLQVRVRELHITPCSPVYSNVGQNHCYQLLLYCRVFDFGNSWDSDTSLLDVLAAAITTQVRFFYIQQYVAFHSL